jgi:hypothetical protein
LEEFEGNLSFSTQKPILQTSPDGSFFSGIGFVYIPRKSIRCQLIKAGLTVLEVPAQSPDINISVGKVKEGSRWTKAFKAGVERSSKRCVGFGHNSNLCELFGCFVAFSLPGYHR